MTDDMPPGLFEVREAHLAARRRETAEVEVEKALVRLSSEVDHMYGELLLAAGRLADKLHERHAPDRTWLGVLCLVMFCATVVAVAAVIRG